MSIVCFARCLLGSVRFTSENMDHHTYMHLGERSDGHLTGTF